MHRGFGRLPGALSYGARGVGLMVALTFGPETTAKWLGGFITTPGYQASIQDPAKIGMVVLFADAAEFWLELYYEFMEYLPFDISFMMEE